MGVHHVIGGEEDRSKDRWVFKRTGGFFVDKMSALENTVRRGVWVTRM